MCRHVAMDEGTAGKTGVAELGAISDERLKWEVAKRMYGADPSARAMIDRKLADVSR